MLGNNLDTKTVVDNLLLLIKFVVVRLDKISESEFSRDENLLSAWVLELRSSKGLLGVWNVFDGASDGHKNLSNGDSSCLTESFTEGTSHTLLESIGSSA